MPSLTRTTDRNARVSLPRSFANAVVIIEEVTDTELRIRIARTIPEGDVGFTEGSSAPLSDRDRDLFLSLLDDPPPANPALKEAARKYRSRG